MLGSRPLVLQVALCSALLYCDLLVLLCARAAIEQLCRGQPLPSDNAQEEMLLLFLCWPLNVFYKQLQQPG